MRFGGKYADPVDPGGRAAYDNFNRLTHAAEAGSWSETSSYDRWGNRWVSASSFPLNLSTPTAATQFNTATNRLQQQSNGQPLPPNAYDAQGNLTNHPWIGQMSYDAEGKIWRHIKGGTTVEFTYDGEGRRVKKRVGTAPPTIYVYDATGQLAADYGTADGTLNCSTCYITADHLGSTRLTTGTTGDTAGRLDYFPFGETIPGGASFGNRPTPTGPRQKFTGKERDTETGLDYFIARYYSAPQGRFTSPDAPFADQIPLDPQSWNLYTYVGNNPLRHVDATGRCFRPGGNCAQYLAGVAKAVGNIPSGIINFPNRSLDGVLGLFNGGQRVFGDLVPDTFTATNADQREGMEAANVALLVSPLAQVGAAAAIEAIGVGTRAEAAIPLMTQNAARGAASEARVLNDMGLTKNTRPITGTAGKSIPDINTSAIVGDIKDVKVVSNTSQVRIQREVASQTGRDHVIVTGTKTHVTAPSQKPPTRIIRRDDLGPQQ